MVIANDNGNAARFERSYVRQNCTIRMTQTFAVAHKAGATHTSLQRPPADCGPEDLQVSGMGRGKQANAQPRRTCGTEASRCIPHSSSREHRHRRSETQR